MEVWLSYRLYLCLGSTLSYICDLCYSKYIYISVCVCVCVGTCMTIFSCALLTESYHLCEAVNLYLFLYT